MFQFNGPGSEACISVNITNDDDYEGPHSFIVRLSETPGGIKVKRTSGFASPSGPLIGPISDTMVVINDAEGTYTLDWVVGV